MFGLRLTNHATTYASHTRRHGGTVRNSIRDALTEREREAYRSAAQDAEVALAAIEQSQERRKSDEEGDLRPLFTEVPVLRAEMDQLEGAMSRLELLIEVAVQIELSAAEREQYVREVTE